MQIIRNENEIYTNYLNSEFEELNNIYRQVEEAGEMTDNITEELLEYMVFMFMNGYQAAAYLLGETSRVSPTTSQISEAIYTRVADSDVIENANKYVGISFESAMPQIETVIRTDGHRMYVMGQAAYAKEQSDNGMNITKIWDTTLDGKERDTHRRLHGTEIPIDDYFETVNGRAIAPGRFGIGEEDCNCRCLLKFNWY